ncbi:hypothetical protein [Roseateles sp. BYS87W]|uniref:Uncharacterized protein n=1 Tax=Pelomonas baiyunensis TaxID=3299026 RepID=A0ABW7GWU8_9BURK
MPLPRQLAAALCLLASPAMTLAATPQAADLACRFRAESNPAGLVHLHFTLVNQGLHDLQLLRWGSPFEGGWFGRFVQVRGPQGEVPFQGALRKRGDPAAGDYLLLRAGQQLQASLTLNDAYALPAQGPLELKAQWRWHDVITDGPAPRPRDRHQGWEQDCGTVRLAR